MGNIVMCTTANYLFISYIIMLGADTCCKLKLLRIRIRMIFQKYLK